MIIEKINAYLSQKEKSLDESLLYEIEKMAGFIFKRQFMEEDGVTAKGKIRLSGAGRCPRQLAYAFHGFEKKGKEVDSRSKLVFWTGDLVELTIIGLAKLAGANINATGFNQLQVKFLINGAAISGRPDGVLFEDKTTFLVEVKSMSSFSFARFLQGVIDESYLIQVNCYMEALGLWKCVFVGLNKDTGVLHEIVLEKNPEFVEKGRATIAAVLKSTPENLPEVPESYKANESGFYPWQCLYCAYWGICRPNAEKVLVKNSYKLKEKVDGDILRRQNAKGDHGDRQVGQGVRDVPPDSGKPGRPKKNGPSGRDAQVPGRPAMESRGKGKSVGSLSTTP